MNKKIVACVTLALSVCVLCPSGRDDAPKKHTKSHHATKKQGNAKAKSSKKSLYQTKKHKNGSSKNHVSTEEEME